MDELPDHLRRYLAICRRIYERMERDGSWPWKDQDWQAPPVDPKGDNEGDTVSPKD